MVTERLNVLEKKKTFKNLLLRSHIAFIGVHLGKFFVVVVLLLFIYLFFFFFFFFFFCVLFFYFFFFFCCFFFLLFFQNNPFGIEIQELRNSYFA